MLSFLGSSIVEVDVPIPKVVCNQTFLDTCFEHGGENFSFKHTNKASDYV